MGLVATKSRAYSRRQSDEDRRQTIPIRFGYIRTVSLDAKSNYDSSSLVRKVRVMSESFTRMHIGDMKLDEWDVYTEEGVSDSN